jgi:hypothetical protein
MATVGDDQLTGLPPEVSAHARIEQPMSAGELFPLVN